MNRIAWLLCGLLLSACGAKDASNVGAQSQTPAPSDESAAPAKTPVNETIKDDTEKLFQNPFDPDAVYLLSQRSGTPKALTVLIKRDSQDGTQYSRWRFNCVEHTAQNLGVASNVQDLEKSTHSMPAAPQHYEEKSRLGAVAGAVCP